MRVVRSSPDALVLISDHVEFCRLSRLRSVLRVRARSASSRSAPLVGARSSRSAPLALLALAFSMNAVAGRAR